MPQNLKKIVHASWESKTSCLVTLASDWSIIGTLPPITLRSSGLSFGPPEQLSLEQCGHHCGYYREESNWVFVLYLPTSSQLPEDGNRRIFLAADFNNWAEAVGKSEWELIFQERKNDANIYSLKVPVQRLSDRPSFEFKFITGSGDWLDVPEGAPSAVRNPEGFINYKLNPQQTGKHIFRLRMPTNYVLVGNETLVWQEAGHKESHELLNIQFLLSAGTQLPLGAIVEGDRTIFRLFAPRANAVKLVYGHQVDESDAKVVDMHCVDGVTWEVVFHENLSGAYYTFRVQGENNDGTTQFDPSFTVLDPYAKACVGNEGPGIVIAPERLQKIKNAYTPPHWHDLVILEAHIRDLVAKAPIDLNPEERKSYTGLRKWIQSEGSYLRELGVNAVELLPIQEVGDFKLKDYHWGYMPVNYFSPASSYALEPEKGSQIEEFRDLVREFHNQDIAVIVDVVYNHVGEPNHLYFIDKYYYFHVNEANKLVNWSGCGNDLRCDTPMARRLIIESLIHLVETYDVDGFRFDLAELMGIDALKEIETKLKQVKPSLILIAEPWSFRGHIQNELKATGYASWNDGFRESIAKYVCGEGDAGMLQYYLSGSPASSRFAAQTINYTGSHDDNCWIDRITERLEKNATEPTFLDRRRTHLMAAILFAALGVPMIAEGQDFMRSKLGVSNTYQLGDLNALDYDRRLMFSGTHAYFRNWIRFRLSESGRALRYNGPLKDGYLKFYTPENNSSAVVAVFNADRSFDVPQLIFAVNPHKEDATIQCDPGYLKGAVQIADHERLEIRGLPSACIRTTEEFVHLPPLSVGLWMLPR